MPVNFQYVEQFINTTFDQYDASDEKIKTVLKKLTSLGVYLLLTKGNTDGYVDYVISFLKKEDIEMAKIILSSIKQFNISYDLYFEKYPEKNQYAEFFKN